MGKARAGSALLTVLLLTVTLALVSFAMSSALLSHYQLAVRYRDSAQADWCARSGLAEFIYRCERLQADAQVTAAAEELLPQFRAQPVLLEPSRDLPARVSLVLDGPRASRDNSQSPLPAQSSYDPPGKTSLPPFSLCLVLKVEWGGRVFFYEALVQQRWPYALAAPGPIRILGKSTTQNMFPLTASRVVGSVLSMGAPVVPRGNEFCTDVDKDFYELLLPHSTLSESYPQLMVGGDFELAGLVPVFVSEHIQEYELSPGTLVHTDGARVEGNADLYANGSGNSTSMQPTVSISENSTVTGQIRLDHRLGGLDPRSQKAQAKLEQLFSAPDTTGWPRISPPMRSGRIQRDLLVTSKRNSALATAKTEVLYVEGGRASCDQLEFHDGSRLILEDCALYCEHNLRLRNRTGQPVEKLLLGSGATLVVGGELVIDGGEMDAGGNGMVIHAHHFLIRASGSYRGAIVAPYGGSFFGLDGQSLGAAASALESKQPNGLVVRGAVLLGRNTVRFKLPDQSLGGEPPSVRRGLPERLLRCPTLANTELIYDPQYLRGLNQFGRFQLKQLLRR